MNKEKGFSQIVIVSTALVLLVGVGIAWAMVQNGNRQENNMMEGKNEEKSQERMMGTGDSTKEQSIPTEDAMKKDDTKMVADTETMMQKQGSYKDYSSTTVESEQKAGNKVVLFFHAPWCPLCKSADSAFRARTSEIPAGVTVLKTDYDSNTELKQKYGVTYQHTFVQIDNNESQVTKWNGGDIDNLKKYLK